MNPAEMLATLTLVNTLTQQIPAGIKAVQEILMAWQKADPTGEDFDLLAVIAESQRPKDPLKP